MRRFPASFLRLLTIVILATTVAECETESSGEPTGTDSASGTQPATATSPLDGGSIPALEGMTEVHVQRVVDGDTIVVELDGRTERVRYIGVDTPETVRPNSPVECYGEEASRANTRLVEGQTVYLEKDISERDRYDRLLRYVYIVQDEEPLFVNLWLVEQGYAQVSTFPPDVKHEQEYLAAQREARDDERGLWGTCPAS